jgi:uncharacterized protein YkwD
MEVRMFRPKFRRTLRLESLESRALLSSGGPTAQEQYMLEMINMARTSPAEMANWLQANLNSNDMATIQHYGVDLNAALQEIASSTPVQPLAWSDTLASTALEQSQYEANNQVQTHDGPGEPDLAGRLGAANYNNPIVYGENSYAYAQSVDHAMKAFLIDWGVAGNGHRGNLLQPNTPDGKTYSEVGIGIVATNPGSQVGPFVMTQDFGRPAGFQPQVVGVVYGDQNGNHMYDPGEGQGGVTIVVDDANGNEVAETTTWDSGGYQIPLSPGSYNVTAVDNGQVVRSQNITVGNDNVEVDFDTSQPWQGGALPTSKPVTAVQPQIQVQVAPPAVAANPTPVVTPIQVQAPLPVQNLTTPSNPPLVIASPVVPTVDTSWLSGWSWWRRS